MSRKLYALAKFDDSSEGPTFFSERTPGSQWSGDVNDASLRSLRGWDSFDVISCCRVPGQHLKAFAGYEEPEPTKLYVIKTSDGRFWRGVELGFRESLCGEDHDAFYADFGVAEYDLERLAWLSDMEEVPVYICSVEHTENAGIDLTTLKRVWDHSEEE